MQNIFAPILEALDKIHQNGVIHRDISPDNIMCLPEGEVKLMDFGAARDYTDYSAEGLSVILKMGFAPIEQYDSHGKQGPWTDIYALGATMYQCLTESRMMQRKEAWRTHWLVRQCLEYALPHL